MNINNITMDKSVLALICISMLISFSCKEKEEVPQTKDYTGNRLAMLQVDYETFTFEGGVEYEFETDSEGFTIRAEYQSPGDIGWVRLYYDELDTLIFGGSIIWSGTGERNTPGLLTDALDFEVSDDAAAMPPIELFNGEFESAPPTVFTDEELNNIWESIANLELVSAYRGMNPASMVQIYLYQPSVGIGNPADWDWLVFLKN